MNKKIKVILTLLLILLSIVSTSYAKYTRGFMGKAKITVAKPISRVEIKDDIFISNYEKKPVNFSVYNYEKNGEVSAVKMNYKIIIKSNQNNAPLKYKLYRVNGTNQSEVSLKNENGMISQISSVSMNANSATIHNYKLEIEYDNESNVKLDENIKISITVQSIQEKI